MQFRLAFARCHFTASVFSLLAVASGLAGAQPQPQEHEAMVRMDDGVRLNASVFVPAADQPKGGWPAIVFGHGLGGSKPVALALSAARRGYVTLAYTVRGQGRRPDGAPSEGLSTPVGLREARDLRAMLDWFRKNQPVNSSKIGITGGSQGGIHSWMAVAHDMGVAAAVPQIFTANISDAVVVNGGINRNLIVPRNPPIAYRPETLRFRREAITAYDAERIRADTRKRDLREMLRGTTVPVMVHYAFEDGWGIANNAIDDFRALAGPRKLYLGTVGHGSPNIASERKFRQDWTDRWFDRWLKGEPNGIDKSPEVEVAVFDTWRHLSLTSFPPPEVTMTNYYLEGSDEDGGRLGREDRVDRTEHLKRNSDLQSVDPANALTSQTLEHRVDEGFQLAEFYESRGRIGTAQGILERIRLDSLRYSTGPVQEDLLIVGVPEVQLSLTGTAATRQIALRLWDVNESTGFRRLISRISSTMARPAEDGHAVRIEMAATAYEVKAGRSIELELSNLDLSWNTAKQAWQSLKVVPLPESADISVHTGGWLFSLLRLPVYHSSARP